MRGPEGLLDLLAVLAGGWLLWLDVMVVIVAVAGCWLCWLVVVCGAFWTCGCASAVAVSSAL